MRIRDRVIEGVFFLCAIVSVVTTFGILAVLITESLKFFLHVSPIDFFLGTNWSPLLEPRHFGVLPLVCGTFVVALGAGILAIPLGALCSVYLSEYASNRTREWLKPTLEILAGIPTVVYGYLALSLITPELRRIFPSTEIFNAASASIAIGVMVLPMVASLSDDAMRSVPNALRYAAYALGGTKFDVSARIVFPAALSGIMASFVLALSRAIGETMVVTLAAGSKANLTWNPLEGVQTMTAYIAQVSLGDTPAGTVEYQTIFAVGLFLFGITFLMNLFAQKLLARFREQYE